MITFPNAKINLGLRIIRKRPDGFHNLQSCFYPIGWSDVLEIIPADATAFSSSGLPIPGAAETNLCIRAYNLLKADYDLPPVHVHLHKLIPIGAGLGGGSADASFALKLLNDRFGLGLRTELLEGYARLLGSDCAFFIQNRPMYCVEKGDMFDEIAVDLRGYHLLLVYPNLAISTAEAYAAIRPRQPETDLYDDLLAPIDTWRTTIQNDFEASLFPNYPVLAAIKQQMYAEGAIYASMSGSGSTVYGIFDAPVICPNQFSDYSVWQGKL
ncbi:4-(cytidine 5'-diphospho)-2-C-methyl-D-erythritol kinase [Spirosoma utsteinense]|uniref:4-diphosphocytidyl-2-C-methyl-D-erythritol kinase n=1 Tax=Spirosoma utsteinense TaxID=2585773 RepID=A0ABR6W0A9_9BACT|nr:4-(cytidine 5'-diphospho)-2-C-methyl-D-erythritol kinase [Spirosoma utsteinense]MBC3783807.1 4-diphosphocytidyl-2-C-methyl-D-erythritol kinase [Spirosoma utsteinense]MBC3790049.1 4-diphosphocytidyl-2-C-methyl-D-erythritol kinase [Spirosoma utsteinense]